MKVERIMAISLDKDTAKEYSAIIVKEQFGRAAKKIKYLGGGSFGRAFEAGFADGKEIVIKFLRAENMLEKEVHDLRLLADNCSVKIPKVLFSRKADSAIPIDCYGMEKVDGKNALFALGMLIESKHRRLEFADKVITALHEIHFPKRL